MAEVAIQCRANPRSPRRPSRRSPRRGRGATSAHRRSTVVRREILGICAWNSRARRSSGRRAEGGCGAAKNRDWHGSGVIPKFVAPALLVSRIQNRLNEKTRKAGKRDPGSFLASWVPHHALGRSRWDCIPTSATKRWAHPPDWQMQGQLFTVPGRLSYIRCLQERRNERVARMATAPDRARIRSAVAQNRATARCEDFDDDQQLTGTSE